MSEGVDLVNIFTPTGLGALLASKKLTRSDSTKKSRGQLKKWTILVGGTILFLPMPSHLLNLWRSDPVKSIQDAFPLGIGSGARAWSIFTEVCFDILQRDSSSELKSYARLRRKQTTLDMLLNLLLKLLRSDLRNS